MITVRNIVNDFQTAHTFSDSTPIYRQHKHFQTAHTFSDSTNIFRQHTHLQSAHTFSDSTHIYSQHTHFQAAHTFSDSTPITYPNSINVAIPVMATDYVLSVRTGCLYIV